jgi:ribosomal protein S18 acetylase RimI-like enzyme
MDCIQVLTDIEIKAIAILAREIWTEHYTAIIGSNQVEYMLDKFQSENAVAEQIKNKGYIYYLIEERKKAVGYFAIVQEGNALFLSKLYVLKNMRGKGIARKAIDFIKTIALKRKLSKIMLTVNKNNTWPIAAYEKLGFVNTGPIVQDIGGGFIMDDYKMELKLS